MRRYYRSAAVLLAVLLCIITFHAVRNFGFERASPAEESAVIQKLQHASAREVVEAWFWGVNHHSREVLSACEPSSSGTERPFDFVRQWRIISIRETYPQSIRDGKRDTDANVREYTVRFIHKQRFLTQEFNIENGRTSELNFVLMRESPSAPWKILSWGIC